MTVREVLPDPGASKKYAEKREASLAPIAAGCKTGFHSASGTGFGHRRSRATRKVAQREAESGRHRCVGSVRSASRERRGGLHRPPRTLGPATFDMHRGTGVHHVASQEAVALLRGTENSGRPVGGPGGSRSLEQPASVSIGLLLRAPFPGSLPRRRGRDPRQIASLRDLLRNAGKNPSQKPPRSRCTPLRPDLCVAKPRRRGTTASVSRLDLGPNWRTSLGWGFLRWVLDPRGGDPRYTRWAANRQRNRSFRCRE